MKTLDQIALLFPRAAKAFDNIAGASMYGYAFKSALANDPEALAAAEKVVACLRKAGVKGLDPA